MGDFSIRAAETLRSVSLILAEDTRHSRRLLDRYEITTPVESYHEHKEASATPRVVERLLAGEDVALISDAGTPLLSDPGERLIQAAVLAGLEVVPIPGASALLAALVASGLSAQPFTFYGFLPRKGRERKELLAEIARLTHTAVLYEAPGRAAGTLAELARAAPDRPAAVARELTKRFEEIKRGTLGELAAYYGGSAPRGEVVIVISGASPVAANEEAMARRARSLRESGASPREITQALITEFGAPRNLAYRLAHTE